MNKDLDEIFSQADKQLQNLEAESREKEFAKPIDQEVDRETSLRFNQSANEQQSYATRHPYQTWFLSHWYHCLRFTCIWYLRHHEQLVRTTWLQEQYEAAQLSGLVACTTELYLLRRWRCRMVALSAFAWVQAGSCVQVRL